MSALDRRADRLAQVHAQVQYHGQRLELYRRLYGSRPCDRLAELERAYVSARERLADAGDAGRRRAVAGERRGASPADVSEPLAGGEEDRQAVVRPSRPGS